MSISSSLESLLCSKGNDSTCDENMSFNKVEFNSLAVKGFKICLAKGFLQLLMKWSNQAVIRCTLFKVDLFNVIRNWITFI